MSQLLSNINGIISAFDKYAKKDGDCATLNKGELKQLIQKEFADVIVNPYDPETIETMLQLLDTDTDGKVDFEEFTVLVFKVAKACYKKVSDCQAASEGQSGKTGSGTTQQDVQTSSKGVTHRFTQEKASNAGSQWSSQEQKPDCQAPAEGQSGKAGSGTMGQRCPDGRMKPSQRQREKPSCQTSQKPSVTHPVRREIEQRQNTKPDPTCPGAHMEGKAGQGRTRPVQQESSTVVEETSCRCPHEPLTPDEEPSQQRQQSTNQRSYQPCQMEQQSHTDQEEVEPHSPEQGETTQQRTHLVEQILHQRQTQGSERREQDVAETKPRRSQEAVQRPTHGWGEECHTSEQRSTCWPIQDPQANQASSGHQEERPWTSEQSSTRQQEQKPQIAQWPSQQQQQKPQTQEEGPACNLEEDSEEEQMDAPSQQPTNEAQRPEWAQTCQWDHEPLTVGQRLTSQQEHWPQGPEPIPSGHQGQEPQSREQATTGRNTCQPLTPQQHHSCEEEQTPQRPGQSQFQRHECQPLSPEQSTSPAEETSPWEPERVQSCEPTENRGPRVSSPRQPFKASWSQRPHKPLQFPAPWSSKQ